MCSNTGTLCTGGVERNTVYTSDVRYAGVLCTSGVDSNIDLW